MQKSGLQGRVQIAARFQRSIRVDADLGNDSALEGFLCTTSFARAITTLAEHAHATQQGAFTWTGPYGTGKSSLVVALASLLGPAGRRRERAKAAVGPTVSGVIKRTIGARSQGWRVLPVMGSRAEPQALVWDALVEQKLVRPLASRHRAPPAAEVLKAVLRVAVRTDHAGLFIILDEMGKILEQLSTVGGDLHFFQELAECASRSKGRLIVLGVLHQSFDEYAWRLSRERREEWSKVQGRYVDIPLSLAGSEQIELLARAIESEETPRSLQPIVKAVARAVSANRMDTPISIGDELVSCWPLHPVTACLLGPISRRRFGQNQRSLFAFLNSREPSGFHEFLGRATLHDLYGPDRLFDYLQANLEPAILASPDGHRWSLAVEALERAEKHQAGPLHLALTKSIALLDLFRERSGLFASRVILRTLVRPASDETVDQMLADLKAWSVIVYREHLSSYAIYAGSDFDLQAALEAALDAVGEPELTRIATLANIRPIVAKHHYHVTGALRWFDLDIVAQTDVERRIRGFRPNGAMGQFLLVVPTGPEGRAAKPGALQELSKHSSSPTALGMCSNGSRIADLAREFLALEHISDHRAELTGDAVARREVEARLATVTNMLETEVRDAIGLAKWFHDGEVLPVEGPADLARRASELAEKTYPRSPEICNELLNRSVPSPSAVKGCKFLLRAMVLRSAEPRLGIEGFPAEGGLYQSLLASTGLHREVNGQRGFFGPGAEDPAQLSALWVETDVYLANAAKGPVTAADVYERWRRPPFGVRDGLCPVLFVAYLLSRLERYTFYTDEKFEVLLDEVTVERLVQDPRALAIRVFDAGQRERRLFEGLRGVVGELRGTIGDARNAADATALARGIVEIVTMQPNFSQRTGRLSANAQAIRAAIRAAADPKTLLHESLPKALEMAIGRAKPSVSQCIEVLRAALVEIAGVYAATLTQIDARMRAELAIGGEQIDLNELHVRAQRVQGLTGDLRLESFVTRLVGYSGSLADTEGIASLAANKPSRDWSDMDVERTTLEIAELAQRFNRAEAFTRVRGRPDGRHAIAIVVGLSHIPDLAAREFEIAERDRPAVLKIARQVKAVLASAGVRNELRLAALAQVGSDLIEEAPKTRARSAAG